MIIFKYSFFIFLDSKLNYYLYDQNQDTKKAIEEGNCERIEEHLFFAKQALEDDNPLFTEGQRIMQAELVADHELNLKICYENLNQK
ncbi:MAG: hypothetical protein IIA82_07360 [Thaumarchaeota archaeon]|nr:hypothetical protein [Nitrososphaerota archaeon]